MSDQKYFTKSKQTVATISPLGKAGGEGQVFLTNTNQAAKVFNSRTNLSSKDKKIDALLRKGISERAFCLPLEKIYSDSNKLVGFTMNLAEGELMQTCVFSRKGLLKKFPHWNRVNLANLAITLLRQIEILHKSNILIGDINPYNIMVNSDTEIYFIDTDSFQVDDLPCTVETPLFTAPELQGADFKKTLRTTHNEHFSIATLLFMIFLPGKNPWEYIGGSDLATNIKEQNFSYPMGEEDNLQAPKGIWEFIWLELNYDLRKAFYNVFKNIKRFNLSQWITVIESYKQELIIGECTKEIYPSQVETTIAKFKSININTGTSPEFKKNLRNEKTELSLDSRNKKIGDDFSIIPYSRPIYKQRS